MAKKKKKRPENEVIAVFKLSTGYEVPIKPMDVKEGLTHLASAIIGEIVLAQAKERGWRKAFEALQFEISDCIIRLPSEQRNVLLKSMLWEVVVREWGKLERSLRKK